jgi:hypothetical protein
MAMASPREELDRIYAAISSASDSLAHAGALLSNVDDSMPNLPEDPVRQKALRTADLADGVSDQAIELARRARAVHDLPPKRPLA